MAVTLLDTAACIITGDLDCNPFFLDGNSTESTWHNINGGDRILVVPGYGFIHFTDGAPQFPGIPDGPWYLMVLENSAGVSYSGPNCQHYSKKLAININSNGLLTGPGDPDHPQASFSISLALAPSWLWQTTIRIGKTLPVYYDARWYLAHNFSDVMVSLISSSDKYSDTPPKLASMPLGSPEGQVILPTSSITIPGQYSIAAFVDDHPISDHGTVTFYNPHPFTFDRRQLFSIAAGSVGSTLHFFAVFVNGRSRVLYHFKTTTEKLSDGSWTKVDDPSQPVIELEVAVMSNAVAMLFALDEEGNVHTKMGDAAWSAPGFAGQLVPFRQLTSSPQGDTPRMIAMDETGHLWQTSQTNAVQDTWSTWSPINLATIPISQDIGSAGSWVGVVDLGGVARFSNDFATWYTASGTSIPAFVAVDVSLDSNSNTPSFWLIDSDGTLWMNASAPTNGTVQIKKVSTENWAPPCPLSSKFCAITHLNQTRIWSVARDLQLWGGVRGQLLWEGPCWRSLQVSSWKPWTRLSVLRLGNANRPYLFLLSDTGPAIWATYLYHGQWQEWISVNSPDAWPIEFPVRSIDFSPLSFDILATAMNGALYRAQFTGNLSNLTWTTVEQAVSTAHADLPHNIGERASALWRATVALDGLAFGTLQYLTDRSTAWTAYPISSVISVSACDAMGSLGNIVYTVVVGLTNTGGTFSIEYDSLSMAQPIKQPAFNIASPTKFTKLQLGNGPSRADILAFAVDFDGFLWSLQRNGVNRRWSSSWTGPGAFNQPAQFRAVDIGVGYVFGIDPLGSVWSYNMEEDVWSGPDWQDASLLIAPPMPQLPAANASFATANAATLVSSKSSTTTVTDLGRPGPQIGRFQKYPYAFTLDSDTSLAIVGVLVSNDASDDNTYRIESDGASYPNPDDQAMYGRNAVFTYKYGVNYGIVHPIKDPALSPRSVPGNYNLIWKRVRGIDDSQTVKALLYKRTRPLVGSNEFAYGNGWSLNIRPIIAWTNTTSATFKTQTLAIINGTGQPQGIGILTTIENLFAKWGIRVVWTAQQVVTVNINTDLSYDTSTGPVAELLKNYGSSSSVNLIFSPTFKRTSLSGFGPGVIGYAGGIASVPPLTNDNKIFGVLASLAAYDNQTPPVIHNYNAAKCAKLVMHEIGHLLGLTHESAGDDGSNLMASGTDNKDPTYGTNTTPDQEWILRQTPLVTEIAFTRTKSTYVSSLTISVSTAKASDSWLSFESGSTDGDVKVSILDAQGNNLYSTNLVNHSRNNFEAGQSNTFVTAFASGDGFDGTKMAAIKVDFSPILFFDTVWNMTHLFVMGDDGNYHGFRFTSDQGKIFTLGDNSVKYNITATNTSWY